MSQHPKTRLYIFVFAAVTGLSASVASAQYKTAPETSESTATPTHNGAQLMTLHDCMKYAISNSTKIRIQRAAVGDAQLDRLRAEPCVEEVGQGNGIPLTDIM